MGFLLQRPELPKIVVINFLCIMALQFKNRELLGLKIHTEVVVKPLELPAPQLSLHHLSPSPPQHQPSLRIIAP